MADQEEFHLPQSPRRRRSPDPSFVIDVTERVTDLKKRRTAFQRKNEFKPGDIVKWKQGLLNRKFPRYEEPAIVVEVLAEPLRDLDQHDSGSQYFREPLDIVLGLIDLDNDFALFHFDSRRFEHFR